jgi:predicted nucleic acid-binding protein
VNDKFILDASVAAKWLLPAEGELLVEEAFLLLQGYSEGRIRLVVPEIFWAETANVLWKAVSVKRCTRAAAEAALASLKARQLPTVSSLQLLDLAFALAVSFQRTVYDSLYVALAVQSNAQVITADQRLANALAPNLPVKWLGALQ